MRFNEFRGRKHARVRRRKCVIERIIGGLYGVGQMSYMSFGGHRLQPRKHLCYTTAKSGLCVRYKKAGAGVHSSNAHAV